jgi:glycerol-3-phosphate O-acyltransferase/dihydroxyacetone phosphate acyltransferase
VTTTSRSGIDRVITGLAGRAVSLFHRVECNGGPVPDGPVLITANHPNSLLDPLIVFRASGRTARPLAKAPLFEQVMLGAVLRALGGLPVYRRQDDPGQMHRNDQTFSAAIAALRGGDAVQIFPEGRSHSEPSLVTMRTGAARIALAAEAEADWDLGLQIVPLGITYQGKSLFRGRALAVVGEPFGIGGYRAMHEADPTAAVRALTAEIADRLQQVTLNLADHDDLDLIDTADRLYAREKGLSSWRQREDLAERLPRLQFFARGLAWLRAQDAVRHVRLERDVRTYHRALALFGAAEADVPPRYETGPVLWYVIREALILTLGFPLALIGAIIWLPAYWAPRLTVRLVKPEFEAIATYKLSTSFLVVPLTLAVVATLTWWIGGPWLVLVGTLVAPLLGLIAIGWRERRRRVAEDARVFLSVLRNRRSVDRLAAHRRRLVGEFDRILDEMESEADSPPAGRAP